MCDRNAPWWQQEPFCPVPLNEELWPMAVSVLSCHDTTILTSILESAILVHEAEALSFGRERQFADVRSFPTEWPGSRQERHVWVIHSWSITTLLARKWFGNGKQELAACQ